MAAVRITSVRMPVAELGPENPLPLLHSARELHDAGALADNADIPADMQERLRYGHPVGVFPYTEQDGYSRELVDKDVRVAILDNEFLIATFLLDYGGRLWSLVDKASGRDLLFNPGHIRLANLALRNAWFAGGVEWNIGTTGHSPTTCAPLHAAVVETPNGSPVLRLYEYERLRGVVFQVDAWLADGSPFLKVHVRIQNPGKHDVPMYWWSNAAVEQVPGGRVVAPADSAWHFGYERDLVDVPMPEHGGVDVSYPAEAIDAADYFFRLGGTDQLWVAALGPDGTGVVQASTRQLRGRKLFRWGTGPGGRRWQDWLGDTGRAYLEIQAGLAETQLEHLRLPAGQSWSWVEAYGPLDVDPEPAHGTWQEARQAVASSLAKTLPAAELDDDLAAATAWADLPPERVVHAGSGWGALEQRRRRLSGEPLLPDSGTPFGDDTLGPEQDPWRQLLEGGQLADDAAPTSFVFGGDWAARMDQLPDGWLGSYLRGLLSHAAGDPASARRCYASSLAHQENPWALRALALLDLQAGDLAAAADAYLQAHRLAPEHAHLAKETVAALLSAERPAEALKVLEALPEDVRSRGRFRMLEAQAAAASGDRDRARAIVDAGVLVDDLREGETALSSLWESLYPGVPLPSRYNFRMKTAG
jgi:tetratricopeptide (TPR) repeat protein